ncbi:hypothetical protein ANCCAN_18370 [Ancylostoma caninum]|uniref:Uncharacterized protein n=1 Tax=Ancylostoma caninum TaxID=29170 RepID=A0A368FUI0_ANCCA|nr:hypothetical protein ANCCAN_18370 [Ancylostoma caninum]
MKDKEKVVSQQEDFKEKDKVVPPSLVDSEIFRHLVNTVSFRKGRKVNMAQARTLILMHHLCSDAQMRRVRKFTRISNWRFFWEYARKRRLGCNPKKETRHTL